MKRRHGYLLLTALLMGLSGCASGPIENPQAVMLDRTRDPVQRLAAAKQLGPIQDAPDPEALASTLYGVLWSDGEPTDLRLLAMDRLIAYDADAFWRITKRRIREVDNWDILRPMIDRMVERGDPALTATLVRSFVRQSQVLKDVNRPELVAIATLNPDKTVEQAIWDVLVSGDDSVGIAARVDAWTLLNRLYGPVTARDRLIRETSDIPLILDLQAAAWLGRLPDNREGLLWLMQLRAMPDHTFWDTAKSRTMALSDEQRHGVELRHLPVLIQASKDQLAMDRAGLQSRAASRLPAEPVAVRTTAGIARQLPDESLAQHAESLCWADLLAIDLLIQMMDDRALRSELFRQADADLADTRTEHGGVLAAEDGRYVAFPYLPVIRAHDQKFYSSDALIQRMYTGLYHYHFHAQQYQNEAYAGPGVGDLGFADRIRPTAVVFTFLDENTLGVDYYQPGGVVVDLGVIRR